MSLCTDLSYQQQDGSAITQASCDEIHYGTTPCSVLTIANISSHLSSDGGCNDQADPLARRPTPEPSSNYPNLSPYGLDTVGDQPKNGRTNLDFQPSPLETDQVLKNGVSSHICISGEDSQKLLQYQTRNRYELRDRSLKNTRKRPTVEDEAYNNENEDLPPLKRAKRVQQAHKQPRKQKSLATCESNFSITTTGTGGFADATSNNERIWPLSGGVCHSNKEDGVERLALYFTRTAVNQRDSTFTKAKEHESMALRDKNLTIAEILRGKVNTDHDHPQTNSLLLSHADLRLSRINGISTAMLSFSVELEGKCCQEHTDQDVTAVITPPEHYQAHTNQDLIPVKALLAKVYDSKLKQFCFLTKWAGSHDRCNEWRKETDLLPEDVERYNRDHKKNFFGKVIAKRERQELGGVYEYKMKWKYQPRHGGYSWLLEEEIEEGLITKYKEEKAQGRPQRKKRTKEKK